LNLGHDELPLECKREFSRPQALVAVRGLGGEVEAVGELEDERSAGFESGLGMADEQVNGDNAGADESAGDRASGTGDDGADDNAGANCAPIFNAVALGA